MFGSADNDSALFEAEPEEEEEGDEVEKEEVDDEFEGGNGSSGGTARTLLFCRARAELSLVDRDSEEV